MTEFLASVNSGVCRKFRGDSLSLLNNLLCSVLNNLTVNIWLWQPQEALISFISRVPLSNSCTKDCEVLSLLHKNEGGG